MKQRIHVQSFLIIPSFSNKRKNHKTIWSAFIYNFTLKSMFLTEIISQRRAYTSKIVSEIIMALNIIYDARMRCCRRHHFSNLPDWGDKIKKKSTLNSFLQIIFSLKKTQYKRYLKKDGWKKLCKPMHARTIALCLLIKWILIFPIGLN